MAGRASLYRSEQGYAAVMAAYDAALERSPVPYDSRTVSTRYGQTHVLVGGPRGAPPVLLFHGWNGNASGIGAEFPFLFPSHRVYMPDIIGHAGRSAPSRPPTAGPAYADWVADVLDALDIGQAIVMGISGGGWMTLKFAAHAPARVLKAVAVSTDGLSSLRLRLVVSRALLVGLFPNRTTVRWFMEAITSPDGPKGRLFEQFSEQLYPVLKHFNSQRNPGRLTDAELRHITSPTLVLMGEHERLFEPRDAVARAQELVPGLVAAEIVPHAGHALTIDQPDVLKARVLRFLGEGA